MFGLNGYFYMWFIFAAVMVASTLRAYFAYKRNCDVVVILLGMACAAAAANMVLHMLNWIDVWDHNQTVNYGRITVGLVVIFLALAMDEAIANAGNGKSRVRSFRLRWEKRYADLRKE